MPSSLLTWGLHWEGSLFEVHENVQIYIRIKYNYGHKPLMFQVSLKDEGPKKIQTPIIQN